jgi:hypothetical protein
MCTELEKGAAPQNSDTNPQNEKHDAFEKVTLATAIVGVVILCIYTALTGYQAYIARDSAHRQLRAYVSAIVERQPDLDGSSPPEVVLLFKNNGQTPAYKVDARASFFVAGEKLTEADIKETRAFLDKPARSESVVLPGQEIRVSSMPGIGIPLSQEQKIAISMGAQVLWVIGEATYTVTSDASRSSHLTAVNCQIIVEARAILIDRVAIAVGDLPRFDTIAARERKNFGALDHAHRHRAAWRLVES